MHFILGHALAFYLYLQPVNAANFETVFYQGSISVKRINPQKIILKCDFPKNYLFPKGLSVEKTIETAGPSFIDSFSKHDLGNIHLVIDGINSTENWHTCTFDYNKRNASIEKGYRKNSGIIPASKEIHDGIEKEQRILAEKQRLADEQNKIEENFIKSILKSLSEYDQQIIECSKERNEYPNKTFRHFLNQFFTQKRNDTPGIKSFCGYNNATNYESVYPILGHALFKRLHLSEILENLKFCQNELMNCQKDIIVSNNVSDTGRDRGAKEIERFLLTHPQYKKYLEQ